ncbi:Serine/threonine-protein phosphatase 6 regulatory ankyrin repeat subunit C (PP6-ARS-C) (Serine/threonine-protein phosphatase 6 regulatory subunit ARS-C) [Durusdinium trenchii]|uniref:Serine/threonine-protein phosphatase 6 regulatory ankyrin repeat subunit C (PP6-ARS-C) (Serine/threonine-protein phosphatase 6 regulatory subunit ARS-C) n=1 Tax=Durusdinium trenchii TaxID=1381693 RepID=A0ABP0IY69_9DINO
MSFFGFLDAYQDGISIAIAFSCPDDTSQTLGWFMLVFYLTGVVVLQWAIMAILCFFDPSSACFAKMMHMDTFAARVTLPTEHQFTWKLLHLSRTLGEDVPQAVLQTIYLLTVTENYFMIISVCTAVCGSLLALYDAYHRALKAAGFHSKTVRVVRAVIRGGVQGLAFEMADGHLVGRLLNQDGSMRELSDWPNVQQDEVSLSLKLQWDECIVAVRGYSSDEPFLLCSRCIIFTNRGTRKQFPPPRDLRALASGEHFDFDFSTSEEAAIWSCEFAGGTCVGIQTRPTTTRDVGPSPPSFVDEPRSSLGSEETAPQEEEVKVQEWVKEPEKRGMNAYQFEVFFAKFCGDVIYEELEEPPKPLCLPTTLCQLCVQANRQDPQVRARTKRPRETNLYAVTELIIKPETCKEGVSYSELINPRGLQVDYFISHHWAEDFGEFVQSVLRHAIIAAPELGGKWKDVVYWCCAFANNQHQIELGETLQKSPFYQALNSKNCKGTVMNLNQAATALDRIWCIYEVYLTHSLEKPFTLNFRLGPLVGVVQETKEKDSWVFHIFKMLQHIDVGQADATNPDDYNKIMGEIENFRSREGTGPKALNRIVKAMLGSQAIFTLARRGDLQAVKRALELDADPNIPDTLGIRPLTYAAGNGHEEVCHALIAGSADVRAQVGALEVLGMFSPQRGERRRCIEHVRVLDEERTEGFHSAAISKALLQHTTSRCQDLTSALDADNAELRLEVVRELRLLLHALVDHSMKLLQGGQAGAGEDERQAISKHSQSLAPYLADPDARVRLAVVEAVTSIGNFDLHTLKVPKSIIQEDNLHAIVDEDMGQNIVHFAASQTCPNALYMLATGVDWAVEPRALRAEDAEGRNVAHLAVEKGHMECLAMMVGDKKLPRAALTHQDHLGRTPVHYAALRGDAATLRAFADLGNLTTAELSVGDNSGSWPQHVAAARGYGRFLGVLVNDCAFPEDLLSQPDGDGRTVAHLAVARGDQDVNLLRYLVETCRMPKSVLHIADTWHRTPAHDAAFADAPEMLSLLQDYGAPLHMPMGPGEPQIGAVAIVNQSSEVVAYLGNSYRIGRVHYVDRHQKMRFEYEKGTKDLETVEVERCELAPTPLVLAEKLGRKKAQQFLSNAWEPIANLSGISKEDIMSQARRGALPAGVLVSQGALSAVQKFLEKGYLSAADLSKRDAMGCSCLHRAASTGVPEAVCAVVELGKFQAEDFLAADAQGWTVLHHAARSGKGACVEVVLLQCHLPQEALGAPDLWGRSPVHLAADADATEVLQALAKHLAPMHATMGRPVLEDGLITLVQPREMYGLSTGRSRGNIPEVRKGTSFAHIKSLGGSSQVVDEDSEDEGLFSVGRVIQVFNNHQVHIKHESGFREGYVELERCTFSPTPIVLAERRGRFQAVQTLIEVAWKPFVDSVASFAMSQNWEWEDLEEDMRSEALRGALPVGALVATKSEELPWLLKELIQAEVIAAEDLLLQDMRGRSALHRAAASGQADVLFAVKELARASNEHLEISDIQGHNLLHHAVLSGDGDTVRLAARMLPMRTPEELAAGDMWHLTPVHLAATINSLEAIKALMELGLPVDKPSGPTKFDIGAVVLVQPKKIDLREGDQDQEAHPWQLGMVRAVTGSDLTVKFPHGGKETKGIAFERCEVAPTPQVLAEKLLKHDVALKLREVNDAFNNTLKKKLGASGGSKFAQAAQAASGASGVVSLMRHSKVVGMEKEGPKLKLDGPKLGRAKSNEAPSSPKNGPKRPREKAAAAPASTARRRFRGAAMSVVANLRLARPS